MAEKLTSTQEEQILQARPDVASEKYYGTRVDEWWDKYGKNEMPNFFAGNAQDVYSADNIMASQQSAPAEEPNLLDIRSGLMDKYGVTGLETQYQTGLEELATYPRIAEEEVGLPAMREEWQKSIEDIRNKKLSVMGEIDVAEDIPIILNKIRGIQDKLSKKGQRDLEALIGIAETVGERITGLERNVESRVGEKERSLTALKNKLMASKEEVSFQYGVQEQEVDRVRSLILEYPDAEIDFSDNYVEIAEKIQLSKDKQLIMDLKVQYPFARINEGMEFDEAMDQLAIDIEKQDIKATFKSVFGYTPKGKSRKWMNNKLKKYYKDEREYLEEKREEEKKDTKAKVAKASGKGEGEGDEGSADVEYDRVINYAQEIKAYYPNDKAEAKKALQAKFPNEPKSDLNKIVDYYYNG